MYVSLLPQFEDPAKGSLLIQGGILGLTQIIVSFIVNLIIVLVASRVTKLLGTRPTWLKVQQWFMASVLTCLAANLIFDRR